MYQEKFSSEVVQSLLPESLISEAQLPSIKKLQAMNYVKHKAIMLFREICEVQVENAANVFPDSE